MHCWYGHAYKGLWLTPPAKEDAIKIDLQDDQRAGHLKEIPICNLPSFQSFHHIDVRDEVCNFGNVESSLTAGLAGKRHRELTNVLES